MRVRRSRYMNEQFKLQLDKEGPYSEYWCFLKGFGFFEPELNVINHYFYVWNRQPAPYKQNKRRGR